MYTILYIFSRDIATRAVLFALFDYLWFASYVMADMLDDNSNRYVVTTPAVRHPECVFVYISLLLSLLLEAASCKLPISLVHLVTC